MRPHARESKYHGRNLLRALPSGAQKPVCLMMDRVIFPQLRGLGNSAMCERYGIDGMGEAAAYLADSTLRARLVEISKALLELDSNDPIAVMGYIDAKKLRSCMTLFSLVEEADPVFQKVLDKYYHGEPDQLTLRLLGASDHKAGQT